MLNLLNKFLVRSLALASVTLASCGIQPTAPQSTLDFIKLTETTAQLEPRDLNDTFLFGLNVIEVKNFFGRALSVNIRPIEAKLIFQEDATGAKVFIVDAHELSSKGVLMTFDAKKQANGKIAVDFASVGNDIEFFNDLGAAITASDYEGKAKWKTVAKPKIASLYQDADMLVTDIEHQVSQSIDDGSGAAVSKSGTVKFRLYLKRQGAQSAVGFPTVAQARAFNIGFFASQRSQASDESKSPISRFKVDVRSKSEGQIVLYLKNFPAEFKPVAKKALSSWNSAFGFNAITVLDAPQYVDIGDPRYNVVKWSDGLEEEVPWAGYAPTATDPSSGYALHAQILINGSTTVKGLEKIASYTEASVATLKTLHGRIGNVPVVQGAGEVPVTTFVTDPTMTREQFLYGYYYSVIMHEFGHALGLRHNFAASTTLDTHDKLPASVMDYEPNWSSARRVGIGSYDRSAIRFGYFGESPATKPAFCTDEDMEKRVDCNQSDFGEPADYVTHVLAAGTALLSSNPVALPGEGSLPMKGAMLLVKKFQKHLTQFGSRASAVDAQLKNVLATIERATPAAGLSPSDLAVVKQNLSRLKLSYSSTMTAETSPVAFASDFLQ